MTIRRDLFPEIAQALSPGMMLAPEAVTPDDKHELVARVDAGSMRFR